MRRIILFGHLSKSNVKEGQTIKGGTIVGQMGSSGMADGKHLHFGYLECPNDVLISADNFTSRNQDYCVDPKTLIKKYGKVSDGPITLDWHELYGSTYTSSNPHPGIDYGWANGDNLYLPSGLNGTVLYSEYNDVYGNYVIMEVEEKVKTHYYCKVIEDKSKIPGMRYYKNKLLLENINTYNGGKHYIFKDELLKDHYLDENGNKKYLRPGELIETDPVGYIPWENDERHYVHKCDNQYDNDVFISFKKEYK